VAGNPSQRPCPLCLRSATASGWCHEHRQLRGRGHSLDPGGRQPFLSVQCQPLTAGTACCCKCGAPRSDALDSSSHASAGSSAVADTPSPAAVTSVAAASESSVLCRPASTDCPSARQQAARAGDGGFDGSSLCGSVQCRIWESDQSDNRRQSTCSAGRVIGVAQKKGPTIPCPDCKGTGTIPRGHLDVEEKTFDPAYASRHFPAICDKCNGSGRVAAPPPSS
jgi:hypothetical protein